MISKMKKVSLIGLTSNKGYILSTLQGIGIVEPIELNAAESTQTESCRQQIEAIKNSLKILVRTGVKENKKTDKQPILATDEVVHKIAEIKLRQ